MRGKENPHRKAVIASLLKAMSSTDNIMNLRATFTAIANSKQFKNIRSVTPMYVANVWYNAVAKRSKDGDTTCKYGKNVYCFALFGVKDKDSQYCIPNRKNLKKRVTYKAYGEDINEE